MSEITFDLACRDDCFKELVPSYLRKLVRDRDDLQRHLDEAKKTWRCFNCGFETSDPKLAEAHFGEEEGEHAFCLEWKELNADGKAEYAQSQYVEIVARQTECGELQRQLGEANRKLTEKESENSRLRAALEKIVTEGKWKVENPMWPDHLTYGQWIASKALEGK